MSRWGNCDFKQLKDLQEKLNKLKPNDIEKFSEDCAKELAARLLAKVIKRTPVGNPDNWKTKYKPEGYIGGTLRRGWTAESEREAELGAVFSGGAGATAYAKSLEVTKIGNMYQIEIVNPVHYAPYVEFGHRTRNHKGWVNGQFFLTISEQELDAQSVQILEKKLMKHLGGVFGA